MCFVVSFCCQQTPIDNRRFSELATKAFYCPYRCKGWASHILHVAVAQTPFFTGSVFLFMWTRINQQQENLRTRLSKMPHKWRENRNSPESILV